MQSENYTPPTQELQDEYPISTDMSPHGTDGPVGSSYPPFSFEISKYFYRAWQSIGVMLNPQSNDGLAVGALYSSMSLTHWNMSRSSASAAYYKGSADQRSNFHLLTGQRVRKILFEGKKACGVEVCTFMPIHRDRAHNDCSIMAETMGHSSRPRKPHKKSS